MTEFIDLIYCSGFNGGRVLACAPLGTYLHKGDIVCIDGMTDFYRVLCAVSVSKDSDTYNFITEAFGEKYDCLHKVTDKYSHVKIDEPLFSSGNGDSENE